MATKLSITLPDHVAARLKSEVEQGRFVDESEAVTMGLCQVFEDQEVFTGPDVDDWARREAVPELERYRADPQPGIPVFEIRKRFEALDRADTER